MSARAYSEVQKNRNNGDINFLRLVVDQLSHTVSVRRVLQEGRKLKFNAKNREVAVGKPLSDYEEARANIPTNFLEA
jgi:hypothetical protein